MLSYRYKKHTDNIPMEDFDMKAKFYICNQIADLSTVLSLHKNPLNIVNIRHGVLHRAHCDRETTTGKLIILVCGKGESIFIAGRIANKTQFLRPNRCVAAERTTEYEL